MNKTIIKKRLTKAGVLIITVSLLISSTPVYSKELTKMTNFDVTTSTSHHFKDLNKGHWAESAIVNAVQDGFVSGYPDGSFKPNSEVSRAEFLSMLVRALKLPVEKGDIWYKPFVNSAEEVGIFQGEFSDFNKEMSRAEMAMASVRAIGKEVDDLYIAMLNATELGLITGVDNEGNLDMWGTTNRAQSVAIIRRVLKVREGITLPADAKAIGKAKEQLDGYEGGKGGEMEEIEDPWGWEGRTTNLPENYEDYPYILKDVPNEAYEKPFYGFWDGDIRTPQDLWYGKSNDSLERIEKESFDILLGRLDTYFNTILNFDWRVSENSWGQNFIDSLSWVNEYEKEKARENLSKYIEYVRSHKVSFEGNFVAHPSMIYKKGGNTYIRAKVEFKINEIGNKKAVERSADGTLPSSIVYYQAYDFSLFEEGKKYTLWADVHLGQELSMGGHDWIKKMYPSRMSLLFEDYIIVSEEE